MDLDRFDIPRFLASLPLFSQMRANEPIFSRCFWSVVSAVTCAVDSAATWAVVIARRSAVSIAAICAVPIACRSRVSIAAIWLEVIATS